MYGYAGKHHFDSAEVIALSDGVVPAHDSVPVQGSSSCDKIVADIERQESEFSGKFINTSNIANLHTWPIQNIYR